jgi:ribosomal protein S18 acetylase RimI-like enzyme
VADREFDPVAVQIRPSNASDNESISRLVSAVVTEMYAHLLPQEALEPDEAADWAGSWVATCDAMIVGVGRAGGNSIDDLWIDRCFRCQGLGRALLAKLEAQIALHGHSEAQLRVVGENHAAIQFYVRNGWRDAKHYPHERWGFEMIDMEKTV